MFHTKVVEKIETFCAQLLIFFTKNRAVHDNVEKYGRATDDNKAHAPSVPGN